VTLPFGTPNRGRYARVTVARVISMEAFASHSILQIACAVAAG